MLNLHVEGLWNSKANIFLWIEHTVFADRRLFEEEGSRIRQAKAFLIEAVTTFEAESDPILLSLVSIVER